MSAARGFGIISEALQLLEQAVLTASLRLIFPTQSSTPQLDDGNAISSPYTRILPVTCDIIRAPLLNNIIRSLIQLMPIGNPES